MRHYCASLLDEWARLALPLSSHSIKSGGYCTVDSAASPIRPRSVFLTGLQRPYRPLPTGTDSFLSIILLSQRSSTPRHVIDLATNRRIQAGCEFAQHSDALLCHLVRKLGASCCMLSCLRADLCFTSTDQGIVQNLGRVSQSVSSRSVQLDLPWRSSTISLCGLFASPAGHDPQATLTSPGWQCCPRLR